MTGTSSAGGVTWTERMAGAGPLVTAVVTTYDRPVRAKRAVRSVLNQIYGPLELVVVEDGTTSGIGDWLDELDDPRVTYLRHETNRGLAAARNTGLERASGAYVAYLDDDDEWKPDRVQRQVDHLGSLEERDLERVGVVYSAVESRRGDTVVSVIPPENEGALREAIIREGLSTLQSSCLFSKAALDDVGGFDEALPSSIDHDIWMALATHGYHAHALDEPLVVSYDEFEDSMMTDTSRRIEGVRAFVEKWRPTYREWLGPRRGELRAQRYFVRVVARLAAANLVAGEYDEAWTSLRAIQRESDERLYPTAVLVLQVFEAAVKRYLPPRLVRPLSGAAHWWGAARRRWLP